MITTFGAVIAGGMLFLGHDFLALWMDPVYTAGDEFVSSATVLAVLHQMDQGDPAALEARLEPLTQAGSGFRPTALELTAVLALRRGDLERARALYTEIADDRSAPAELRRRASQMLTALGQ
jgi:hypothetical protein